jgi:hypothetical protein
MKLYAVCVVQDEEDIISACIEWASRFCDKILIWDIGSSDNTWKIIQGMKSSKVFVAQHAGLPYGRHVLNKMIKEVFNSRMDPAWIYKLDADEFLVGDPKEVIQLAEADSAEIIHAWHLDFCVTPSDLQHLNVLGEKEWVQIPLFERMKYYQIKWREWRFVRLSQDIQFVVNDRRIFRHADGRKLKRFRHYVLIRHYRYRSPTQVARRYRTRQAVRQSGYSGFRHDIDSRLEHYAVPESKCRIWYNENQIPTVNYYDSVIFKMNRLKRLLQKKSAQILRF